MSLTITTSPWLKLPRLKDENCFRCFSDTTTVVLRSARSEKPRKQSPKKFMAYAALQELFRTQSQLVAATCEELAANHGAISAAVAFF